MTTADENAHHTRVRQTRRSPLLTLTEAAELARMPLSSLRYIIACGKLASVRPGRLRLIRRVDLAAFLGVSVEELA